MKHRRLGVFNNASARSAIECFPSERKRSPRCLQALAIQVDRCFARKSKMATKTIMTTCMHAIFSDSIFGMTMYVSLCGYMKWKHLNRFALISNQWGWGGGGVDLFVTGRSHFYSANARYRSTMQ